MELLEDMIQHIQSFLNIKEATRTTLISKSWNKVWVTRNNLNFSLLDFVFQGDFIKVTERTLERYEESKQKIQSFRLVLKEPSNEGSSFMTRDMISLGIECIKKAMKLGPTYVHIEVPWWSEIFILPCEVFESVSLVDLYFVGGKIDGQALKVSCSRLEALNLCQVYIHDNIILDIISMCPLIEYLELCYCRCPYSSRRLVLKSGWGVNDLRKLKILSLYDVEIGEGLFRAVSKSPYLENLSLTCCTGFEEIQICSDSLESITIFCSDEQRILRAKFDVPRIRKFVFIHCSCVPSLCFKTNSRKWESIISFPHNVYSSRSIVKFRKFLSELSSSKIYFELSTNIPREEDEGEENVIGGLPKPPMVDTFALTFSHSPFSIESNALKDLFLSCRPKAITLCVCMKPYDLAKLICYTTIKEEREIRNKSSLHDLEKVDVKISGQIAWTWSRGCPVPTNTQDEGDEFSYWYDKQVCLQWR